MLTQVTVYVPKQMVDRAMKLLPKLDILPDGWVARKTKAAIFKLAIIRGLKIVEEEMERAQEKSQAL